MKRLLSIELQKLWKNRASRVLVLTYFILLSFIALLASVNFKFIGIPFRLADQGIFNFPFIWHFNTFVASILKWFLAIIIVSMIANEYTYGTLKQNLIDGLSKKEFIASKVLMVIALSLASTVFVFIMSLILGYIFSSYTEPSIVFSELEYVGAYFIKITAFFSFCLFVAILIKRSAFAIGFVLLWWIIESIVNGLCKAYIFTSDESREAFIQFLPLESMQNLIIFPLQRFNAYKMIEKQVSNGAVEAIDFGIHWYQIAIVVFWTLSFCYLSYRILKRRDL